MPDPPRTRRSTLSHSNTLYIGLGVHQGFMAVVSVAKAYDAAMLYLGPRQVDIDQRMRKLPSTATHLVFVYDADPCGYGLDRYLTQKNLICGVVAPSFMPKKAGDRVTTDRRDAVPRAWLRRSGDLTRVDVPTVDDAASRDLTRFDTPRQLMQCLGLIPAACSSGERRRRGAITKAGNTHAHRAIVAGAWAYHYPAKVSRPLQRRLETQPKAIKDISGQAQVRLCTRYRRLMARGKHANQVVVALARELVGFIWAMAHQTPMTP